MMVADNYYILGISPHVMLCTRELYEHANLTATQEWLFITNEVLYYLFPVIIAATLAFTLINSIVTARMVTDSHECYLTGFNISSFILVLVSGAMQLPTYMPLASSQDFYATYGVALPYLLVVENWCFYTCSWLLLTAVSERAGHAICGRWHASFGRIHGILASLLIVIIGFVCTLPQYWEYQSALVYDEHDGHNCSRLVIAPVEAILKLDGGYTDEYYYYHWVLMAFSLAIPYLFLPIMIPAMACVKMHTYSALNLNGHISTYADDYATKEYMTDEKDFNRLLSAIVMIYLVLSGPRNALKLLHNPPLFLTCSDNKLLVDTLAILFDLIFYFMFIFLFLVNVCGSAKFRRSLKSLRSNCCCCRRQDESDDD